MSKDKPLILLVDKPPQMTSFDVIKILRKKLDTRKIGHSGTLDPLATGLLVVGVREGTKQLNNLLKLDKTYEAEILLGESRTTGDMAGEVVAEKKVAESFSSEKLSATLSSLEGELFLPVSPYSAIKKDGVPMYKRAYKAEKTGDTVDDLPIKNMRVIKTKFLGQSKVNDHLLIKAEFVVGSGTYIRSLAEEFGKKLGYPAVLKSLRRTAVGNFKLEDAKTLEEIS